MKEIEIDLQSNDEQLREIAKIAKRITTRKVVKRPVMTIPYGVTRSGAIRHILEVISHKVDPHLVQEVSKYLMEKIFDSVDSVFQSSMKLKKWLTNLTTAQGVASTIKTIPELPFHPRIALPLRSALGGMPSFQRPGIKTNSEKYKIMRQNDCQGDMVSYYKARLGNNMAWISPLGMPVQQFSYEKKPHNVDKYDCWEMHLNSTKTEIMDEFVGYCPQVRDTPDAISSSPCPVVRISLLQASSSGSKNGIAPNFVHTLDASHAQLTNIYMTNEDLPFQSVHDSYWTTASNVARMNYLLRKAFVEMYQHEYPEASFQIDFPNSDWSLNFITPSSANLKAFKSKWSI